MPLLDKNVPPCGLVALKHIIDDGEFGSNALIGYRIVDEITQLTNVESKSMSSVFTPVSQDKFLIDMNSGTYGYYNPLYAQLKTVGKFPEMSLSMIVDQFGAGKRNLVYCNFKANVVSSAVKYEKLLKPVNDIKLIELAQEIREQVYSDYCLAYTVERGVAFHVGYIRRISVFALKNCSERKMAVST